MEGISLILTLAAGLTAALIFGLIAQKLKLSPIVGYLFAGIAISPYSPGFVGNIEVAQQFADIGVVLLLFGVGLNFRFSDLIKVYKVAVPGAITQIILTTITTIFLTYFLGWSWKTGFIFGMAISVASTVVLTRVLSDNRNLHTPIGHTAVGWLVLEDLFTIFVLVLIPVFFNERNSDIRFLSTIVITTAKLSVLIVFVLFVGQKLLPKILEFIAKTGNRELFTLSILVLALGIAVGAAEFFNASMALGAFLAGMVVGQSEFSARATSDAISISDAFSVLFFVSVGMLFDVSLVVDCWKLIILTLFIVLVCKPLFAITVVLFLKQSLKKAVSVGIALGQIGEFSFILASLGTTLHILPQKASVAIITVSIISITLNTIIYKTIPYLLKKLSKYKRFQESSLNNDVIINKEEKNVIVVGYGPVGKAITGVLLKKGINVMIVEMNIDTVRAIWKEKKEGLYAIYGDATQTEILIRAGIETAEAFIVSAPSAPVEEIIQVASSLNPRVWILAHTTFLSQAKRLRKSGIQNVSSGEGAGALVMSKEILKKLGTLDDKIEQELKLMLKEQIL